MTARRNIVPARGSRLACRIARPSSPADTGSAPGRRGRGLSGRLHRRRRRRGSRSSRTSGAARAQHQLPETMGSGVAWLDYDNDGWMDLYVVQSGPFPPAGSPRAQDRLYHNNGNGTFTDVTEKAELDGHGATGWGRSRPTSTTTASRTSSSPTSDATSCTTTTATGPSRTSRRRRASRARAGRPRAAFADFDGDGLLDLFVVRYLDYSVEKNYFCGDAVTGKRDYCHPSLYPPDRQSALPQQRRRDVHGRDGVLRRRHGARQGAGRRRGGLRRRRQARHLRRQRHDDELALPQPRRR